MTTAGKRLQVVKMVTETMKRSRPIGISISCVLLALSASMGIHGRITIVEFNFKSLLWIVLHLVTFILIAGLWTLKKWAYWGFLALVISGGVLDAWRLISSSGVFAPSWYAGRLVSLAIWLVYLSQERVRRAFNDESSDNLRVNCPQCRRLLKGATKNMIGDTGVCPKCKAEFTIVQEDSPKNDGSHNCENGNKVN